MQNGVCVAVMGQHSRDRTEREKKKKMSARGKFKKGLTESRDNQENQIVVSPNPDRLQNQKDGPLAQISPTTSLGDRD